MSMRCLAVMCHAPAPPHHRLLPRANSCLALFPNPTAHTLRTRTSDPDTLSILSLLASLHSPYSHSLTLSLCTFHPFVVTTLALSNSIHVFFHGVRETGLFTHGRASLNFTIIPMFASDVAVPCLCDAGQGREMPLRHRTIGSSRSRTLALPSSQPHSSHPGQSHI